MTRVQGDLGNVPRGALRSAVRPRSLGLAVVAAAHAALGWLLVDGLSLRLAIDTEPPPIQASMLTERPKPVEQPAPPEPRGSLTQPVQLVEPVFQFETDVPPQSDTFTATAIDPGPTTAGTPQPRRTGVALDPRHPLTQPPYPAASIRFGEEGSLTVEVRVGVDGRVREARVLRSSGYARLDAAALEEARRVWRLQPATEDGAQVEAWYAVRVSFRLDRH